MEWALRVLFALPVFLSLLGGACAIAMGRAYDVVGWLLVGGLSLRIAIGTWRLE